MTISYNDGGTWRTITAPSYKDGSTWRTLVAVHYNDSGTWRQVFGASGAEVALSDHIVEGYGVATVFIASATMRLKNDGVADKIETDGAGGSTTTPFSGEWLVSGSAGDYESRMTTVSGSLSSGTTGTWQALSTTRSWVVSRLNPAGTVTYVGTLEIRRASDSVVLATATITLSAIVDP